MVQRVESFPKKLLSKFTMTQDLKINAKQFTVKNRWSSSGMYRLILFAWMTNELSIAFVPAELAHTGLYINSFLHIIGAILVGIPLVYSEICIAQYTNCNAVSMFNYFPLFRGVGYGTFYLVLLKAIYTLVIATWYLRYSFYSCVDPPPWYTCDEYNNTCKCMVKRVNVSIFQHCLEMQQLYNSDCGMKTSSSCFFNREFRDNTVKINWPSCMYPWKSVAASALLCFILFLLCIKNDRFLQISLRFAAFYVGGTIFVLFCVALSTNGTWYATKIAVSWSNYSVEAFFLAIGKGFLCVGTGSGLIVHLARDVPFRSPATMITISASLLSTSITIIYALIAFCGIKTMSYYHGGEENIIEVGESPYFTSLASMSEIMIYFHAIPIWAFIWYSSIYLCLFINEWVLFCYLREIILDMSKSGKKYAKSITFLCLVVICALACPFFCSDLTPGLTDAIRVIQLISNLLFSISLYWFYGFNKHNIDIIFMIGIKASWFWKLAWIINPIILGVILFVLTQNLVSDEIYDEDFIDDNEYDNLVLYILVGIYLFIILAGMLMELYVYFRMKTFRRVVFPAEDWGPKDAMLFKSRKMFVPEIMTREFLYRQVRIHGYVRSKIKMREVADDAESTDAFEGQEWSACTSN